MVDGEVVSNFYDFPIDPSSKTDTELLSLFEGSKYRRHDPYKNQPIGKGFSIGEGMNKTSVPLTAGTEHQEKIVAFYSTTQL